MHISSKPFGDEYAHVLHWKVSTSKLLKDIISYYGSKLMKVALWSNILLSFLLSKVEARICNINHNR